MILRIHTPVDVDSPTLCTHAILYAVAEDVNTCLVHDIPNRVLTVTDRVDVMDTWNIVRSLLVFTCRHVFIMVRYGVELVSPQRPTLASFDLLG